MSDPACHKSGHSTLLGFVVTPYPPDARGALQPRMPQQGPCAGRDAALCRVTLDHFRPRTTGPCFPLAVVRCLAHHLGFTLYPPGHVPYGRAAVAPVAPDGNPVHAAEAEAEEPKESTGMQAATGDRARKLHKEADPPPTGVAPFRGTVFEAALDAAQGVLWQRDHLPGGTDRWWSTQGRRLQRALRLLGLAPRQPLALRHEVAELLSVHTLLLAEQARAVEAQPGYRRRGQAVCRVLGALVPGASVAERIYATGHRTALWGQPHLWHAGTCTLRKLPFRPADTRAPP